VRLSLFQSLPNHDAAPHAPPPSYAAAPCQQRFLGMLDDLEVKMLAQHRKTSLQQQGHLSILV
jgi:hypothetical protein